MAIILTNRIAAYYNIDYKTVERLLAKVITADQAHELRCAEGFLEIIEPVSLLF